MDQRKSGDKPPFPTCDLFRGEQVYQGEYVIAQITQLNLLNSQFRKSGLAPALSAATPVS
jgi:hypothetical protein